MPGDETPRQLLDRLAEAVRRDPAFPETMDPEDLRWLAADRFNVPEDEMEEWIDRAIERRGRHVETQLVEFAEAMPEEVRGHLLDEDVCYATLLPLGDFNAHALRAGNGGWLIVVNQGVMTLAYKVARSLALHFSVDDADRPQRDGSVPAERSAGLIAHALDWYLASGMPLGPDFEIEDWQRDSASELTTRTEKFVLAHEIAHHVLGHLDGTYAATMAGVDVEALALNRQRELEADAKGLEIHLGATDGDDARDVALAYAGAELAIHTIGLLDAYAGRTEASSHPTATERLRGLREHLTTITLSSRSVEAAVSLAHQIDALVETVRPHVLDPTRRRRWAETTREFEKLLNELLDRHSRLEPGDARAFVSTLHDRLQEFPPGGMSDALAARIAALYDRVQAARSQDEATDLVNRLSLIAAYVMPTPGLREAVAGRTDLSVFGDDDA